jgi:hypothetical protein
VLYKVEIQTPDKLILEENDGILEIQDFPYAKGLMLFHMTAEQGLPRWCLQLIPNSSSDSQFFILLTESRLLDNQYTMFTRVVECIWM